ncbi:MAG: prenyltransferase [Gammaproteobacteria bacterium]|nr:prenyltransferase [Gammaproteobacteria bacterium]
MRIPFLVLSPVCVFLGYATASVFVHPDAHMVLLVLLGAVAAHVSVNAFNEYLDFTSGLDLKTTRTPFSGGSGAIPASPEIAGAVLMTAVVSLGVTIFVGGYMVYRAGAAIVPIGVAGIVIILAYTGWITRHPVICLLAPGLGFGPLMVIGTHVSLTGEYSMLALAASLIPMFLVSNLLLLNQYPDVEADRSIGRNHWPIAFGRRNSNRVYAGFALAAGATILIAIALGYFPYTSAAALLTLGGAWVAWYGAFKHGGHIHKLTPYLGVNVAVAVLTPLALGITLAAA